MSHRKVVQAFVDMMHSDENLLSSQRRRDLLNIRTYAKQILRSSG